MNLLKAEGRSGLFFFNSRLGSVSCKIYGRLLFIFRAIPLKCINEYLVFALEADTAVQDVVRYIVWAFRWLKKLRNWEMSVRGYALHSVFPQLSFFITDVL